MSNIIVPHEGKLESQIYLKYRRGQVAKPSDGPRESWDHCLCVWGRFGDPFGIVYIPGTSPQNILIIIIIIIQQNI